MRNYQNVIDCKIEERGLTPSPWPVTGCMIQQLVSNSSIGESNNEDVAIVWEIRDIILAVNVN